MMRSELSRYFTSVIVAFLSFGSFVWGFTFVLVPKASATSIPPESAGENFNEQALGALSKTFWTAPSVSYLNNYRLEVSSSHTSEHGFTATSYAWNDCSVEADITPIDTDNLFSKGAGNNGPVLFFRSSWPIQNCQVRLTRDKLMLVTKENYVYTTVSTYLTNFTAGLTYHIKVRANGSNVQVFLGNTSQTPVINADISVNTLTFDNTLLQGTNGYHRGFVGIGTYLCDAQFDNFIAGNIQDPAETISVDFNDETKGVLTRTLWVAPTLAYAQAPSEFLARLTRDASQNLEHGFVLSGIAWASCSVEADLIPLDTDSLFSQGTSNNGPLLFFRSSGPRQSCQVRITRNKLMLVSKENYTYTTVATYTNTFTAGNTYHVKVLAVDENVKVYLDNDSHTPVIDADIPVNKLTDDPGDVALGDGYHLGKCGVGLFKCDGVFDNFGAINHERPLDVWSDSDMGGGGYFNEVEAGPTGIIFCNSDLSGTYISYDRGASWECVGASRGLTATHACGLGFDPTDEDIIFIGCNGGLFRSADQGATFRQVIEGGFFTDIKVSASNPQIVYATATTRSFITDAQVYKSIDNGVNWTMVCSNAASSELMFQELAIQENDDDTLYAHSYPGRFADARYGLFKSEDGGITWNEVGTNVLTDQVFDFAIEPGNPDHIYASLDLENDIVESVDGGTSWTCLGTEYGALHINPDNTDKILSIGSWRYSSTTNAGANWIYTQFEKRMFLPGSPWYNAGHARKFNDLSDPQTFFYKNACWAWATFDGFQTFKPLWTQEVSDQSGWWMSRGLKNTCLKEVEVNRANPDVVYVGFMDMGIWRSLDHGITWQSANHTDYSENWSSYSVDGLSKQACGGETTVILSDPARENVVWANMDKGLYRSSNYGKFDSWVLCEGLPTNVTGEVIGSDLCLAIDSPATNRTLYLTVEGSVYASINDGADWSLVSDTPVLTSIAADPEIPNLLYGGGEDGFYLSLDAGQSWASAGLSEMEGISFILPDPSVTGRVYAVSTGSGKGLYRSNDNGLSWTKILTDNYLRSVAVDPQNPQNLYAASSSSTTSGGYKPDSHGVLVSSNGGVTWTPANEGLAWPFAWDLAIDPENPEYVFCATTGLGLQVCRFSHAVR